MRITGWLLLTTSCAVGLTACSPTTPTHSDPGGGGAAAQGIRATIQPSTILMAPQETITFTAAVSGTADVRIAWTVAEPDGGTVDASGRYTAPSSPGVYHVVATSVADTSSSAVAMVTVSDPPSLAPSPAAPVPVNAPPSISSSATTPATVTAAPPPVTISPTAASLAVNGTQTFSCTVTGLPGSLCNWSVSGTGCGSVYPASTRTTTTYTAPGTVPPNSCSVAAAAASDASGTTSATVTVTSGGGGSDSGIVLPLASPQTISWDDITIGQMWILQNYGPFTMATGSDGTLGAYMRFGAGSKHEWNMIGPGLWDQTQPFTLTYQARISADGPINWGGMSVLYSSEGGYQSGFITGDGDGSGAPYAWPFQAATYNGQIGTTVANGAIVTVSEAWDPSTGQFTVSVNGRSRTDDASDWRPVAFPQTLWWGQSSNSNYIVLDVGAMTFTGNRMWGAADDYGWSDWILSSNASITAAADGNYAVAGCGSAYDCPALIGGLTASGGWTARSPMVGFPVGYKFDKLRLFTQGTVAVYVRYADGTNAFGGSTDANTLGTPSRGVAWTMNGTRMVDLSGLMAGKAVYLDVQGTSGSYLRGAWISFKAAP